MCGEVTVLRWCAMEGPDAQGRPMLPEKWEWRDIKRGIAVEQEALSGLLLLTARRTPSSGYHVSLTVMEGSWPQTSVLGSEELEIAVRAAEAAAVVAGFVRPRARSE